MAYGNEGLVNEGGIQPLDAVVYNELGDVLDEATVAAAEASGAHVTVTRDPEQALTAWRAGASLLVLGLEETQPTFMKRWLCHDLLSATAGPSVDRVAITNNPTARYLVRRGNDFPFTESPEVTTTLLTGLFQGLHRPVPPTAA